MMEKLEEAIKNKSSLEELGILLDSLKVLNKLLSFDLVVRVGSV